MFNKQVQEYVQRIKDLEVRRAFVLAMAKYDGSTVCSVYGAFYDVNVLE